GWREATVVGPRGPLVPGSLGRRVVGPCPRGWPKGGGRREGRRWGNRVPRFEGESLLRRRLAPLRLLRDGDRRGRLEVLQVGGEAGARSHARDDSPVRSRHATGFPRLKPGPGATLPLGWEPGGAVAFPRSARYDPAAGSPFDNRGRCDGSGCEGGAGARQAGGAGVPPGPGAGAR